MLRLIYKKKVNISLFRCNGVQEDRDARFVHVRAVLCGYLAGNSYPSGEVIRGHLGYYAGEASTVD